jgi:stage V sporulation protein B
MNRKILGITLPVAFSSYIRSGLITLEHLLIPWGLKKNGSSKDASLAAYGTVQSMVFPLVLFPSAISSSFAGLLIPEMAEANADGDKKHIVRIAEKVFKSVLIFSIGTAGIMMCLSLELGHSFYPDTEAGKYILMVAPLIPVMYLDTSVDSMLKGLGKQTYTMLINVIDALLSVILVFMLLPRFGIYGFIITVYFTEIINATLSIVYLLRVCAVKIRIFEWIAKPLACVCISTSIFRYILSKCSIFAQTKGEAIVHVFVCGIIYLLFLVLIKVIDIKSVWKTIKRLK